MLNDGSYEASLETSYSEVRKRLYGRLPPRQVLAISAPVIIAEAVAPYVPPVTPEIQPELPAERIRKIIADTARRHGCHVRDIQGKSRSSNIVPARSEACYRLFKELGMDMNHIAKKIGYADHSSVFTAIGRHEIAIQRMETK